MLMMQMMTFDCFNDANDVTHYSASLACVIISSIHHLFNFFLTVKILDVSIRIISSASVYKLLNCSSDI